MKISLVIPAYNEQSIIADTIQTVEKALIQLSPDYEIVVVDDGSQDDTAGEVERLQAKRPDSRLRLVSYQPNRGKGCAVRTGILEAQGDVIFCTDADLAYGVAVLAPMLQRLQRENADLVIGSRRLDHNGYRDYPPLRLLASRCFGMVSFLASGLPYDTQCGIKGYRREAGQAIFRRCRTDGFAYDFEVLLLASQLGFRVTQMPVRVIRHRDSKVNVLQDSLRILRDMVSIRSRLLREAKKGDGHEGENHP
ncbi:MAG: glycosyltransferase [Eubacteriales bacterium]